MTLTAQQIQLSAVRSVVQQLRASHHALRHEHIPGCVECIMLEWLKDHDF